MNSVRLRNFATLFLARKLASGPCIFKMSERFVDASPVDSFIAEKMKKAALQKTQRGGKVFKPF